MSDLTNIPTPDAETLAKRDARIAEITARVNVATEGPWQDCELTIGKGYILDPDCCEVCSFIEYEEDGSVHLAFQNGHANKKFVRHARADIPWLLARLTEAEKQRDDLSAMHQRMMQRVEEILKPEWEQASRLMFGDGNSSWCGVVHIAVGMIREQLEKAQEDYADSQASLSKVQGERDALAKAVEAHKQALENLRARSASPALMQIKDPEAMCNFMETVMDECKSTEQAMFAALAASQGKGAK